MLRHVPKPVNARRLRPYVRVEPARDGAVDRGLLLLVQQRDQLLLGADRAADPPVGVVEEAGDSVFEIPDGLDEIETRSYGEAKLIFLKIAA